MTAKNDMSTRDSSLRPWWPEKAQLFSSAHSLFLANDRMDPTLIAIATWWRDRARRAFLTSFYSRGVSS